MARKACKNCKKIYEGDKCPECGSTEHTESFKGQVIILNSEESQIAKKMNLKGKGTYAVKTK